MHTRSPSKLCSPLFLFLRSHFRRSKILRFRAVSFNEVCAYDCWALARPVDLITSKDNAVSSTTAEGRAYQSIISRVSKTVLCNHTSCVSCWNHCKCEQGHGCEAAGLTSSSFTRATVGRSRRPRTSMSLCPSERVSSPLSRINM